MHVTIDTTKCQGHGRCVLIAPDVFDIDDDGLGAAAQGPVAPALEHDVRRAADSCPESAIRIT